MKPADKSRYAEGGEVEDQENLMDHVALEAVNAVHLRDKAKFRDAFHVLVSHTLAKMGVGEDDES